MPFFQTLKYTLIIWTVNFLFIFSQNDSLINQDVGEQFFLDEIILKSSRLDGVPVNYHALKKKLLKVYPYIDTISQLIHDADSALKRTRKKRFF